MTKDQAIAHFGSTAALARALLVTYQAVHNWDDAIPPLRQLQIERITNGSLTAEGSVFPDSPPTLNANLRPMPPSDKSAKSAVNLSSVEVA